ncbi:MAG: methionine adenosyltransferase [Microthrixaceae bacterium]|nr:methionine adenosyltransferase [Microthrixaceae bacterium]
MAHPVSILVETFGTERVDPTKLDGAVREVFDLRPGAIVRDLELLQPIYARTSAYGHSGAVPPMAGSPGSAPTASTS